MAYSEEDKVLVTSFLLALRKDLVQQFAREQNLLSNGTKADLKTKIAEALGSGNISYSAVTNFLDRKEPWNKQHIFIFDSYSRPYDDYRDQMSLKRILTGQGLGTLLNKNAVALLPRHMQLTSILHNGASLRVAAVSRREGKTRAPNYSLSGNSGVRPLGVRRAGELGQAIT